MLPTPDILFQELFTDLHKSGLWHDQKIISDAFPKKSPKAILEIYRESKNIPGFDLKEFFEEHFSVAADLTEGFESDTTRPVKEHIENLWPLLERKADAQKTAEGSSLIPLPHPYIVPGGRFNEIYYWDSYFTMLGLQLTGKVEQIQGMIDNFSFLIDKFGHIPNGNRTYFLSRSQPPFYALMIELLAESKDDRVFTQYLPQLKKEYEFWMRGQNTGKPSATIERLVPLPDGKLLNRYFDNAPLPRQEMHQHDVDKHSASGREEDDFYLNMRSACESGWDFSCRWFEDIHDLSTVKASEILPVDLNCLVYQLEKTIAKGCRLNDEYEESERFKSVASARAQSIQSLFWNAQEQFYFDYNFIDQKQTNRLSLAAMYPLFFAIATQEQAEACAKMIQREFLKDGGLVSTPYFSGQQWDAPNGWAPLQWIAIKGLINYELNDLAIEIARRWLRLNENVFKRTGKMMEKYNVVDLNLLAGGGEYEGQAGFGWTNGVYLKLLDFFKNSER
ncbi:MAG: alpha,alpha-trehalase TreF [Flavobacteriaceae bacterium]|nr:alpha,alpha-trehalase TreF [Flavobacteriaceae bacterium]